ncbi:MAG: hypothetical protein HYZ52_03705 [Candidatus Omnitrophica bacterium]|nr:hypothetical protein [Candidatus Omnitrophota bacterium]
MPIYRSKDNVKFGVPLGGIGAGKLEILPSGVWNAFTFQNNWSRPLAGNAEYPGILGYHLGIHTPKKSFLLQTEPVGDIPLVREIEYEGVFPRATLRYREPGLGLQISLDVFSPWIPGDVKNSSLPGACFSLRVKNGSGRAVDVGILFIGRNLSGEWCVGRRNKIIDEKKALHLEFSNEDPAGADPRRGALRFSFLKSGWDTSFLESWNAVTKNFTFDPKNLSLPAWDIFAKDGRLPDSRSGEAARGENQELCGAVSAKTTLSPGEEKVLSFAAAWHYPNAVSGHRYERWFKNAGQVSRHILSHKDRFEKTARSLEKMVFSLPFPDWFNDALLAGLSPFFASSWFLKDGRFAFYEAPEICPLMGTLDVGFYGSTALAWFFPELEKAQLRQFARAQRADGYIPHDLGKNRVDLPSDGTTFYRWKDLNSKFILMAYRDFLWGGKDKVFLKEMFPHVKRAMRWISQTDRDGNGLPDNEGADQTFDLWDFQGTNAYTSGLYLAALLAAERMARLLARREEASFYHRAFWRGRVSFEKELWNGAYFGDTCALSQLNGQWAADLLGLGPIADPKKIQTALRWILKNNGRFSRFGLVNSVTRGGRIDVSNNHSKNIWVGMNCAFVSLGILRDLPLTDLLKPLRRMWDNVTWVRKSPWNQPDMIDARTGRYLFGDFYYRNMAIWSVPVAWAMKNKKTARILGAMKRLSASALAFFLFLNFSGNAFAAAVNDPYVFLDEVVKKYHPEKIQRDAFPPEASQKPAKRKIVEMSGKYRLSAGVGKDFILNDSNPDQQERNFRYLFGERLNNTFDRAIYDQYQLNVDFKPSEELRFYTKLVADPWSWVGTTGEQVQPSDIGGEVMRYNLKYWGANNSVLNEIWRTNVGDSYAFPVIKIHGGETTQTVVRGFKDFNPATNGIPFTISRLDIDYEFRPLRELWMDYNQEDWRLRLFPLASQTQALTSDDPLELSNHKDYWQQSPWLYQYKPIQFFTDNSIKRGYYSDNLSFLARDSEGNRLVLLRGASLEVKRDRLYLGSTVAAPYTPWDEKYFAADNIPGAVRLKYFATDKATVGGVYTFCSGLIDNSVADFNQVFGIDAQYDVSDATRFKMEGAASSRERDQLTDSRIQKGTGGYAAKMAIEKNAPHGGGSTDTELSLTYMDRDFEPNLSRYSNTRDDHFWGKHLTFDDYSPALEHFRIGDGVDTNRYTAHFRWREKRFKEKVENLFDARNVHRQRNNAYLETVVRDELTWKAAPWLTAKGLFRWQGLPKSSPGIEPFLSNFYFPADTVDLSNLRLENAAVKGEKDPSRFTYSGGLQAVFNKQWTAEGILEITNDLPDFPRGLLNDTYRDTNDRLDGLLIDHVTTFLYDQGPLGGAPPYEYFAITKQRLIYKPEDRLKFIFHAAQNGYKFAAGIDDNISHEGLSVECDWTSRLKFFADYTHSRQIDVPRLVATSLRESDYRDHHNVYFSMDYRLNSSAVFRAEYGVFGMGSNTPLTGPYNTTSFSLPTIDTEHLLRLYLEGDF